MRGLKFRVWCKRTQEYHTPIDEEDYDVDGENLWLQMCIDTNGRLYFIETSDEDAGFEYVTHDCEIIDSEEAEDFIVEQYTGLKDKNDKEIYEGDVIRFDNVDAEAEVSDPATVVYENGAFLLKCSDEKLYKFENDIPVVLGFIKPELFEVIGNIHENLSY